jgi:signal transduction histidine kinase
MLRAVPPASILVVDDNVTNRELAQSILEDEGYVVRLASGGEEAITAFGAEPPDCVLLDIRMPGVDGFAVCERIRKLPGGADVQILFLTALRDLDSFDRALSVGGNDFITKPVRPAELLVRVRSALELTRLNVELREHYELLRRHRDELFRVQLQKERLSAFVVHDLKSPVSALDLYAQALLREEGLPEKVRHYATRMRGVVGQVDRMLQNLLDISQADEGKLALRRSEVDLGKVVRDVIADLHINAEYRHITLRAALEAERVDADVEVMRRALTNLVENAIRYAPRETSVTISAVHRGAETELRVTDSGTGIPIEMRDKIFDPFVRGESGRRVVDRGGHGLGLTFCKLAVEAHGGRIWIEDAAPGAVFCLTLPDGVVALQALHAG